MDIRDHGPTSPARLDSSRRDVSPSLAMNKKLRQGNDLGLLEELRHLSDLILGQQGYRPPVSRP